MGIDTATLVERDHHELARAIGELAYATGDSPATDEMLDVVSLGLAAHAAAEAAMLELAITKTPHPDDLSFLVAQVAAAHRAQQRELDALVQTPRGTSEWFDRAGRLGRMILQHDEHERRSLFPALREALGDHHAHALAATYATERLWRLTIAPTARRDDRRRRR